MLGVPNESVFIIVVLCGGVWIMLDKNDVACMLATGVMIVVAMEMLIWAITGNYAVFR